MSTILNVTTNVSCLGVANSWTTSTSNTFGGTQSEDSLAIAGTPASWTMKWTTGSPGKLYSTAGASFVFSAEPSTWSSLTNGQRFTVYWTNAAGVQQYVWGVTMNYSGSHPLRTWTATNAAYKGKSTADPTDGELSSSTTPTMFNIVIAPETTDAQCIVPGTASDPALAQMFVTGARTGLIVLEDDAANLVPFLVGPFSGSVWTGSGTCPISTLTGTGTPATGATKAWYSTADTSIVTPIVVGYLTN